MNIILYLQKKKSVPITSKVVSSNPAHSKVNSIQHYAIKSVSDMQHVSGFLRVFQFPPPRKQLSRYNLNIVEIGIKLHNPLLKKCFLSTEFLKTLVFVQYLLWVQDNYLLVYVYSTTVFTYVPYNYILIFPHTVLS